MGESVCRFFTQAETQLFIDLLHFLFFISLVLATSSPKVLLSQSLVLAISSPKVLFSQSLVLTISSPQGNLGNR